MADISVVTSRNAMGWVCAVQVSESNGQTRHTVNVSDKDLKELANGKQATAEEIVRKSFEFLLERESKNQILRQFDLPVIAKYFPDYPAEILKRL